MHGNCMKQLVAEGLGTAFLLAVIVGSGIAGSRLSGGTDALILAPHALATGGILFVMIKALGPISGAHFNPAVTLGFLIMGEIKAMNALLYIVAQIVGGVVGILIAHVMFGEASVQMSQTDRSDVALLLSELLVTAGLAMIILLLAPKGANAVAPAVGVYVALAIWSSSSTAFANPAVSIARTLTDTVTGIGSGLNAGFRSRAIGGGSCRSLWRGLVGQTLGWIGRIGSVRTAEQPDER